MAENETIKTEVAAMQGWALEAKKKADVGNYKEALKNLKNVNQQGRKLEWKGKLIGLNELPYLEEVKFLKKKITSARAAAQTSISSLEKLTKLPKGKNPAEVAAIKVKENNLKKETSKNIIILLQILSDAKKIVDAEPWMNLDVLVRSSTDKLNYIAFFLRGDGFYRYISDKESITLFNKWRTITKYKLNLSREYFYRTSFENLNFRGANFEGVKFRDCIFENVDFTEANLSGTIWGSAKLHFINFKKAVLHKAQMSRLQFVGSNFEGADLSEAYCIWTQFSGLNFVGAHLEGADLVNAHFDDANLNGANLTNADLGNAYLRGTQFINANLTNTNLNFANLEGANLNGANLTNTNLNSANLEDANLKGVIGLTKEALHSARNWNKARSIPPSLL